MLGKVPVETAVSRLAPTWTQKRWARGEKGDTVSAAVYVDNVWLFSNSAGAALRMMRELESELLWKWALKFKSDSKEVMVARGNEVETYVDDGWTATTTIRSWACTWQATAQPPQASRRPWRWF